MKPILGALLGIVSCFMWASTPAAEQSVGITHSVKTVDVIHNGKKVRIERHPDTDNMLDPDYSLTSRPCPPFCIQPMVLAPGVETVGELELLEYLKKAGKDDSVLVIDSRDGDWPLRSGVIPGAVLLPWQELHPGHTDPEKIAETMMFRFGATRLGHLWNFENAKTLVLYCNGPWCGQSPTNIKHIVHGLSVPQAQVVPCRHAGLEGSRPDHRST